MVKIPPMFPPIILLDCETNIVKRYIYTNGHTKITHIGKLDTDHPFTSNIAIESFRTNPHESFSA